MYLIAVMKILNGRELVILNLNRNQTENFTLLFCLSILPIQLGGEIGMSGRLFVITKPTNWLFVLN